MSTFLEIVGRLTLRDDPRVWILLARLEKELVCDVAERGFTIDIPEDCGIIADFDFAGECGGVSGTAIEQDLAALSDYTLQATCLMVGWDNIREKQFFGPPGEIVVLKSRLALEEIGRLRAELLPSDRIKAADLLLAVSP